MTNLRLQTTRVALFLYISASTIVGTREAHAQWHQMTSLPGSHVFSLFADNSILYASTLGITRSTDNGTTWTTLTGDPAYQMIVHNGLLEAAIYGQIMVSADSGKTWTYTFLDVEPIFAIVAQGMYVFAGSGILPNGEGGPVGIFRTTDDWVNWTQVNNGFLSYDTRALVSDAITLFAGTANGVFTSINNGDYWTKTFFGIPDTDITALALHGPLLYAGTSGGHIYRSSDGGWNWATANQGLPSSCIIRAFAFSGSVAFSGTSNGVFVSYNNGTTWQAADPGPTGPSDVTALAISGPLLFVGDYSTGLWADTLSRLTSIEGDTRAGSNPEGFSLSQNYPNPFNPVTMIRYTVAGSKENGVGSLETRLVVYDILGREAATLVNERKAAGRYTVDFNGVGLTSGTYFYRLRAGNFVETRRMVLLK